MSWIPEFELGIWNAWIPMIVVYPLSTPIVMVIDKWFGTGDIFKKMGEGSADTEANRLNRIYLLVLILLLTYSIFLPLKVGTVWFTIGLILYLAGLAMFFTAIITGARTPQGRVFTQGVYRYSRHPGYLAMLVMIVGVGAASASWLFLLFSAVLVYLQSIYVAIEERECLEKFGPAYLEYMNRTSRWFGLPKSG